MLYFLDTKLLTRIKTKIAEEEESYKFLCKACKTVIADERFLLGVNGETYEHSFTNPHGYHFNLYTFSECQSVIDASLPSFEYTWFPGYAWIIVTCAVCLEHLGWRFESAKNKPANFYALIKEKLEKEKL